MAVPSPIANPGPGDVHGLVPSGTDRTPGLALGQADIDEFKAIVERECGVGLSDRDAWARVIELLNLYRALLGPIPEDPERPEAVRTSSPIPPRIGDNPATVD